MEGKLQQDAGADEQPQRLQAGGQDHLRVVHWTQLGYHGRPDRAKDKVQKRKRQSKVIALLFFFVLFRCAKLIYCLDGLIRFDCTPKEAQFFFLRKASLGSHSQIILRWLCFSDQETS